MAHDFIVLQHIHMMSSLLFCTKHVVQYHISGFSVLLELSLLFLIPLNEKGVCIGVLRSKLINGSETIWVCGWIDLFSTEIISISGLVVTDAVTAGCVNEEVLKLELANCLSTLNDLRKNKLDFSVLLIWFRRASLSSSNKSAYDLLNFKIDDFNSAK